MFCSKCGSQISSDDMYCPKCGALNSNYVEAKETNSKTKSKASFQIPILSAKPIPKKNIVCGITTCIVLAIIVVGVIVVRSIVGNTGLSQGKVAYSPRGLYSYLDEEGNANFIIGNEIITLPGPVQTARTSPDHKKQLVISEDKKLLLYSSEIENDMVIDSDVRSIPAINDECVYYTVGETQHLFLYDFAKEEITDIGFENSELSFSLIKNTAVSINESGELSSFCRINNQQQVLCNVGDDADIICVADDGSNLFWRVKSGNTYSIYTMKNGTPERIGKITNSEKYSSVYGYYYDDDKSCILYSPNSTQMILYKNDTPNEIALPGTKTYATIVNANGEHIDSDDDIINDFYISVRKNKNGDQSTLYQLLPDGSLTEIVENIDDDSYEIRNKCVFYINTDGDLYRKKIGDEGEGNKITTDVSRFFVSPVGKYVYIVKVGGLYYWNVSDKNYKLNLISSTFTVNDSVYVTNKDNVIFYDSEQQGINDSYRTHGTLYRYTIGESTVTVTTKVMDLIINDTEYFDAEHPVIRRYVSNEKSEYIVDYGTFSEGAYVTLLSGIEY